MMYGFDMALQFVFAGEAVAAAVFAPEHRAGEFPLGSCAVFGGSVSFEIRPSFSGEFTLFSALVLMIYPEVLSFVGCEIVPHRRTGEKSTLFIRPRLTSGGRKIANSDT